MKFKEWYDAKYHELSGFGLWLRGEELGRLPSEEFLKRPYRVLFSRLSSYFDTAESTTHQILYQIASENPKVFPDLGYLPLKSDGEIFQRDDVPWLLGTASKSGPEGFHLIGLSLSIVQELINIPTLLRNSGIPLGRTDRLAQEVLPLIILGGASALFSGCLWGEESPVDGVYVGEDLDEISKLIEIDRMSCSNGLTKRERLERLSVLDGFVVPGSVSRTRKAPVVDLNSQRYPTRYPSSYLESEIGTARLPISEGCPCFCSFCAESWDRKPYRERSFSSLVPLAMSMKREMAADTIELFSFNFNLHREIYPLITELCTRFSSIGLKSQRLDLLAEDPDMVSVLKVLNKSNLTVGLEGISSRQRAFLHKSLDTAQVLRGFEALLSRRQREIKVFLIATGREDETDYAEFRSLLGEVQRIRAKCQSGCRLIFSVTPLVRFPWTPLEFDDAPETEVCDRIARQIKHCVVQHGFEFRASAETAEYYVSQVLARASSNRILDALMASVEKSGFVYYKGVSDDFAAVFREELARCGISLPLRGVDPDHRRDYPWSNVETGVREDFLRRAYTEALESIDSGYCLGRPWAQAKCLGCAACSEADERDFLVQHKQEKPDDWRGIEGRLKALRSNSSEVSFAVEWTEKVRGVPDKMAALALACALFSARPSLSESYLSFVGSSRASRFAYGLDEVALRFKQGDGFAGDPEELLQNINAALSGWGRVFGINAHRDRSCRYELEALRPFKPDKWLMAKGLKHTIKRNDRGGYDFEFGRDAAKKGYIVSLSSWSRDGSFGADLTPGPKLELEGFVQSTFAFSDPREWARVLVRAVL